MATKVWGERPLGGLQAAREAVESWDDLLASPSRGFFVGTVVAQRDPIPVRHPVGDKTGTTVWTPYVFLLVLGGQAGEVAQVQRFGHPIQVGDRLAVALSFEGRKPEGNYPDGYFVLESAVYSIDDQGRVRGGSGAIAALDLPLSELIGQIQGREASSR